MSYTVEFDSDSSPYRQVVIRIRDSYKGGHRCGYVSVPPTHPWHGKDYRYDVPVDGSQLRVNPTDPVGRLLAAMREEDGAISISYLSGAHGGLTFSSDANTDPAYPVAGESWWFGFDAAHCDDNDDGGRSLAYMKTECEKLSQFLKAHETDPKP